MVLLTLLVVPSQSFVVSLSDCSDVEEEEEEAEAAEGGGETWTVSVAEAVPGMVL